MCAIITRLAEIERTTVAETTAMKQMPAAPWTVVVGRPKKTDWWGNAAENVIPSQYQTTLSAPCRKNAISKSRDQAESATVRAAPEERRAYDWSLDGRRYGTTAAFNAWTRSSDGSIARSGEGRTTAGRGSKTHCTVSIDVRRSGVETSLNAQQSRRTRLVVVVVASRRWTRGRCASARAWIDGICRCHSRETPWETVTESKEEPRGRVLWRGRVGISWCCVTATTTLGTRVRRRP